MGKTRSEISTREGFSGASAIGYKCLPLPQGSAAVVIFEFLLLRLMSLLLLNAQHVKKNKGSCKGPKQPHEAESSAYQIEEYQIHEDCEAVSIEEGELDTKDDEKEDKNTEEGEHPQQGYVCKTCITDEENIPESSQKDLMDSDVEDMTDTKDKSPFMDLFRLDYTDSPIPPVEGHVYYKLDSSTSPQSSALETDGGSLDSELPQNISAETPSSQATQHINSTKSIMPILDQIANDETPTPHITMKYELLRLCTLRNFPQDNKPYLTRLASAGFYYAGKQDEVICYSCGLRRKGWSGTDDPFKIHKQASPTCRFITNNSLVNYKVPDVANDSIKDKFAFLDSIPEPAGRSRSSAAAASSSIVRPSSLASGSQSNQLDRHGHDRPSAARQLAINTEMPKHPQYAIKATRLASFNGWPDTAAQSPEVLANSGFYYAGFGDCVRCFFCGTGLRHWDKEDDPFIEHARWSKDCVYLNNVKGREFVDLVQMAVRVSEESVNQNGASGGASNSGHFPNDEISRLITSDAAQSVLEMGYEPKIIKEAIGVVLKEKGREGITSESIMLEVFNLEERSSNRFDTVEHVVTATSGPASVAVTCSNTPHDPPKKNVQPKKAASKSKKQSRSRKTIGSDVIQKPTSISVNSGPSSLEELKRENEKLKAQSMCSVCKVSENCIVFLPCGHLVTCESCSKKVKHCTSCNAFIKGTVRTYMS